MPAKLRPHVARTALVLLAVVLGLTVALAAPRAPATFGGKNGRIVFASTPTPIPKAKSEIYTMRADGSDARRLTNNATRDYGPTFSPDGKRIAFSSERDGNREIYLMNADGTDQHRLTHNRAVDGQPAFSPDGKRIAFASDRTGHSEIYVMNADGTDQHRLTHLPWADDPTFFPNGKKIAFVRADRVLHDIFTMRADGTHFRRLTHHSSLSTPDVSPNGERIVAWRGRGQARIEGMRADGTHLHDLGTPGFTPVFSPSGKKIAFERAVKGRRASRIFVMRADGSHRHALTTHPDRFNEVPDWGPRP
jgi:Tol biopolymer transport system component